MNEYAKARGHRADFHPTTKEPEKRKARALTEEEKSQIAERRAMVHSHLPELVPFIKELHERGAVDGWRCVRKVEIFTSPEKGKD